MSPQEASRSRTNFAPPPSSPPPLFFSSAAVVQGGNSDPQPAAARVRAPEHAVGGGAGSQHWTGHQDHHELVGGMYVQYATCWASYRAINREGRGRDWGALVGDSRLVDRCNLCYINSRSCPPSWAYLSMNSDFGCETGYMYPMALLDPPRGGYCFVSFSGLNGPIQSRHEFNVECGTIMPS